jgi:ribosomal peptide maturation radical SAM protein 1
MPWADVAHPSLALGLVKSHLAAAGIRADVAYLNLVYADRIGPFVYREMKSINILASEWVFAEGIGGEDARSGYLDYLSSRGASPENLRRWRHMRDTATEYFSECFNRINWDHYRIVGFGTSLVQTIAALRLARMIKVAHPEITTVFGGSNVEGSMGRKLHALYPQVDLVVHGESDDRVGELFRRVLDGADLDGIAGISFRRGRTQVCIPSTPPVADLDALPLPAYDDFFEQLTKTALPDPPDLKLVVETSRGCWWGESKPCTFCALNGPQRHYRAKSVPRIVDELKALSKRHHIMTFAASDNVVVKRGIQPLGESLATELPEAKLFVDIRAHVSRDEMAAMARGGIVDVVAGIESLSTRVLSLMNKGTNGLVNLRFLRRCVEFGIAPLWNYLYGFPGERYEDYAQMAHVVEPWLHHLPAPDVAFPLSLQRFSRYHEYPQENGIELTGALEDYTYTHGFGRDELEELAYYFQFRYCDGYAPEETGRLVLELVARWRAAFATSHLLARKRGPGIEVLDTRGGGERRFALDFTDSVLLRLCESPTKAHILRNTVRHRHPRAYLGAAGKIGARLERLVAARLLYTEDSRYLTLTIPEEPASFWLKPLRTLCARPALR